MWGRRARKLKHFYAGSFRAKFNNGVGRHQNRRPVRNENRLFKHPVRLLAQGFEPSVHKEGKELIPRMHGLRSTQKI
jgi:hypothetical protein